MRRVLLLCCYLALAAAAARAQEPSAAPTAAPAAQPTAQPAVAGATPVPAGATPSPAETTAGGRAPVVLPPEKAQPVRIPRVTKPPVVDARLDDEAWQQAVVLKDFYQVRPGDNIAPSRQTEVLVGYDSKNLYVAFRAWDDAGAVRATVARRDQIFADDYVGMYLDTHNDGRRAYAFYFNPLGVQGDAVYAEGGTEDYSVDVVMESKGALTPEGYVVEITIPFKSLRYTAGPGRHWGVHFFRGIQRFNNEFDSWMPFSRDNSGTLNQAGRVTGLEGLAVERTLELIPNVTLSETGRRVRSRPRGTGLDPGRTLNEPLALDPGLTAKLSISTAVTLDVAINPDFAQVEADQPVVTANQRFPIFFTEKRPFFLEGIEIFRTPITVVHTRAIIDPDYAVKLTGKRGRNTFGLLLASDNGPGDFTEQERTDPLVFPRIERFLDKNAHVGVLRLKRDVGKENHIGFLATSYSFIEKHNHTGGVDGRFRLDEATTFDFQAVGTHSRHFFFEPLLGQFVYRTGNAFGYAFNLNRTTRHVGVTLSGDGRTRDYVADVGFVQRTNTNRTALSLAYNSEPKPKARLVSYRLTNGSNIFYDWQGRIQFWNDEARAAFTLPRQTSLSFGAGTGYERVFEEEFGQKRTPTQGGIFAGDDPERQTYTKYLFFIGGTNPSRKYSATAVVIHTWGAFDFDFGAGRRFPRVSPAALVLGQNDALLDPGPGSSLSVNASFTYQPTDSLRTSLNYTKSRLRRYDTDLVAFDDNIYSWRTTYQFTRFIFARARVDYTTLNSRLRMQYLLGWAPNPGTSFYAGYNDDLLRDGFSPFTGQPEPGFRRNGRVFFVKMSYLFRRSF
jgi:hypothetical protein